MDVTQTLGQRIVEAARFAVAAHLHASLADVGSFRQRVVIGGAGPVVVGTKPGALSAPASAHDDAEPITDESLPRSHRPPGRSIRPAAGGTADGGAE